MAAPSEYNLEQLDAHDSLVREGQVTTEQHRRRRDTVFELAEVPLRFGLSHGDLTPRNLIQPAGGPLVLIEWGSATFGPVPWVDLVHIDRDARLSGTDATRRLDAFLDGMGLDLMTVRPTFEKFRLLQLLDLVRWATERRPDRLRGTVDDLKAFL